MLKYDSLSKELTEKILKEKPYLAVKNPIRRDNGHDKPNLWRPAYIRDIEKILHSPYYNRYSDKTQVFSLYKNDDISRRALHVQLVARIAKNIGRILGLDTDLIEAIALGHDMGHTPFGHAGEKYLNELYHERTGRFFNHNVHSVRVFDGIFNYNLTLDTLSGILCHNGEFELQKYSPCPLSGFEEFDEIIENCYTKDNYIKTLIPSTLEGCVVRISDIIAYIGKDRQDALKAHLLTDDEIFENGVMGKYNSNMINNLIVNIIENSYGKDYISLSPEYFEELKSRKSENYEYIYGHEKISELCNKHIRPRFYKIYEKLISDLKENNKSSVIFRHHIDFVNNANRYYNKTDYAQTEPDTIVTDFIASMTDDYFMDLYKYLFPKDEDINYISYFD